MDANRSKEPRRPHASSFDIFTRIEDRLWSSEGLVKHMYKDTAVDEEKGVDGNVTVGIGFLLRDETEVDKYPWRYRKTFRSVPKEVARAQWRHIGDNAPRGKLPTFYLKYTSIELSEATIRTKFLDKLTDVYQMLWGTFAIVGFSRLPPTVQVALFDLAWNTGTEDFERGWPMLNEAVKKRDWIEAARQSHRESPPVSETRNDEIRKLFLQGIDDDQPY